MIRELFKATRAYMLGAEGSRTIVGKTERESKLT